MGIKLIKLKKGMLNSLPSEFLVKIGAYSAELKSTFPDEVYLSGKDMVKLHKNLAKHVKKEYKGYSNKYKANVIGIEWLNHGPSSLLEKGLKPGYALVDFGRINQKKSEK